MARAPVVQDVEALPEADRLDAYPHPRDTKVLHGHARAEHDIALALEGGRSHHAMLLSGREGIGKATLAYRIARFALAGLQERGKGEGGGPLSVPPESVAARQVAALSHPGLLLIRRTWDVKTKRFTASIPVDEVRRVKMFLAHAAGPDSWRVVIVDQADELNANAANALLKSLEEPPPRALFLLISSQPGRLLPTIRSRCRKIDLALLGDDHLTEAATAALTAAELPLPTTAQWPPLLALAHGSVRQLLALSGSQGLARYEKVHGLISLLPRIDWPKVHALADEITGHGSEEKFEQTFDLMMDLLSRLIRARALEAGPIDDVRLAARIIPPHGLAEWAELWQAVHVKLAETMALNLDRKGLILDAFARMQAAARGA